MPPRPARASRVDDGPRADDAPLPPATVAVGVVLLALLVCGGALLLGLASAPGLRVLGGWVVLVGVLLVVAVVLSGRPSRRPAGWSAEQIVVAAAVGSTGLPLVGWGVLLLDGGWRTVAGVALIVVGAAVVLVVAAVTVVGAVPPRQAEPPTSEAEPFWVAPRRPEAGPEAYPVRVDGEVPDDPLARIRRACLELGLHEGSEFSVQGFPTMLGSEHVDLRVRGRWFEVVYSDMGRDYLLARLASPDDAREVFLAHVADLATGRGHVLLQNIPRIRMTRPDEDDEQRIARFEQESHDDYRRRRDPDAELYPSGWLEMRALSDGVVAYLGAGTRSWPGTDEDAARAALVAAGLPASTLGTVQALVEQACRPPADWGAVPDHGRWVRDLLRIRHGGLTTEAADALAWNATFQWR